MIVLLLSTVFAADQVTDTASGGTLDLQVTVNFAGFTNCSVQGASPSTAFQGPAVTAIADFGQWGEVGPSVSGDFIGESRAGGNWGVGTDVDVVCQDVSGAPSVTYDVQGSTPNAIAGNDHGLTGSAGFATGEPPTPILANGLPNPMTIGLELAPSDPSGTVGTIIFRFVTP